MRCYALMGTVHLDIHRSGQSILKIYWFLDLETLSLIDSTLLGLRYVPIIALAPYVPRRFVRRMNREKEAAGSKIPSLISNILSCRGPTICPNQSHFSKAVARGYSHTLVLLAIRRD